MMMIGGVLLFNYGKDWVDGGATNAGELLTPPTELRNFGLDDVPGTGRWRLLLVCEKAAGDDCVEAAKLMNSIPILVGKDKPRLLLVLVTARRTLAPKTLDGWAQVETNLNSLQQQLVRLGVRINPYSNYSLIVDPDGRAVLVYRRSQIGSPLLTDLKRLLRLSLIG